jgi:outer membrane lipoprotein carrier protein
LIIATYATKKKTDINSLEINVPFTTDFLKFFKDKNMQKKSIINTGFTTITDYKLMLVIFFFVFCPFVGMAAELPPIDDVALNLQHAYEKTDDFKADFVQKTIVKSIKKTDVEEGSVFFKKPKNMLWKYTKPKEKKLIINSREAWLYLPQEKIAYTQKSEYIFQSKVLIKFLSGLGKLKDDFSIKYAQPEPLDKNGNYLLLLIPLEKSSAYNSLKITVDKNSFYILQVSFDDFMGNSTILRFSNIFMNTGLSQKMFQFKPPAGIEVFQMP